MCSRWICWDSLEVSVRPRSSWCLGLSSLLFATEMMLETSLSAKCFCLQVNVFLFFFFFFWMHSFSLVSMCCHGYPSLTQVVAPQVIPKGKWSWMIFRCLILFNRATPGEGAIFFSAWLTEWIPPPPQPPSLPHLLSRQVPGWMGHHRHWDWGDDTHTNTYTNTHTHAYRVTDSEMRPAFMSERLQSDSMKSCLSKEKTAAWIELSLEGNSALLVHPSVWKWMDLSSSFILSNVNLSSG